MADAAETRCSLVGAATHFLAAAGTMMSLLVQATTLANRDEVSSDAGMLNFPETVEIENVTGGEARDVIRGNDLPNHFSGKGGNDELVGRGGDDDILLSGPGDLGAGADALNGGEGDDQLNGGIDNDAYLFQNGWGKDLITDDAVSGGTDRLFFGDLTSPVTVDLATGTATDGTNTNTVTWTPSATAIENAIGGTADDFLYGNDSGNKLNGQGGDDTISGGDGVDTVYGDSSGLSTPTGDDTIDVADGDAGDTVDCGPDATMSGDTVDVDAVQDPSTGTIDPIDSATNCETVNRVLIN
jgi:Ca2+-binding RTX toxin-like protein